MSTRLPNHHGMSSSSTAHLGLITWPCLRRASHGRQLPRHTTRVRASPLRSPKLPSVRQTLHRLDTCNDETRRMHIGGARMATSRLGLLALKRRRLFGARVPQTRSEQLTYLVGVGAGGKRNGENRTAEKRNRVSGKGHVRTQPCRRRRGNACMLTLVMRRGNKWHCGHCRQRPGPRQRRHKHGGDADTRARMCPN